MNRDEGLRLLETLKEKVNGQIDLYKSLKNENRAPCCTEFDLQRKKAEMLTCGSWEPGWFEEYLHMYSIGLYRKPKINLLKEDTKSFIKKWEKEAQEDIYLFKEEDKGSLEESLNRIHQRLSEDGIPPIDLYDLLQFVLGTLSAEDGEKFKALYPFVTIPILLFDLAFPYHERWEAGITDPSYLSEPEENELLIEYLNRIREGFSNETREYWHRSYRSFVYYIRENLPENEKGFMNMYFPERGRRELAQVGDKEKNILLKNPYPSEHPIHIFEIGRTIQALIDKALGEDSPNTRITALQTLAFAWICIACAFNRVSIKEKDLHSCEFILSEEDQEPNIFMGRGARQPLLEINTECGTRKVKISRFLYDYLKVSLYERGDRFCIVDEGKDPKNHLRTLNRKLSSAFQSNIEGSKHKTSFLTLQTDLPRF